MWLAVASQDAAASIECIRAHQLAGIDEVGRQAADAVVDFDADESACPACGAGFATAGVTHCPECGLRFA